MPNEALSVIGLFFKFTIVKMQRTIINDLIIIIYRQFSIRYRIVIGLVIPSKIDKREVTVVSDVYFNVLMIILIEKIIQKPINLTTFT